MQPRQAEKVARFKARIDFEAALSGEDATRAVRAVWPDMLKAPGLDDRRWAVAGDTTWRPTGGAAREWVLRRDAEQIAIVIFVSSDGPAPARDFFISRTTENMMVDSPFVKGPPGLGTIAVSMPQGAPENLIWVFHNVAFDVRNINARPDIAPIARWLQSIAAAALVPRDAARLQAPAELHVSTHRSPVGAPIDIRMATETPPGDDRYKMELELDERVVDVMSHDRLAARVRGLVAGRTTLDAYVIELATLLTVRTRIELEFLPALRP